VARATKEGTPTPFSNVYDSTTIDFGLAKVKSLDRSPADRLDELIHAHAQLIRRLRQMLMEFGIQSELKGNLLISAWLSTGLLLRHCFPPKLTRVFYSPTFRLSRHLGSRTVDRRQPASVTPGNGNRFLIEFDLPEEIARQMVADYAAEGETVVAEECC
jgi:hypothetical protein